MRFDEVLRALAELEGGPHAEGAAALVARFIASWPDEARVKHFGFPSSQLTPLLRPLLRVFEALLGPPLDAVSGLPCGAHRLPRRERRSHQREHERPLGVSRAADAAMGNLYESDLEGVLRLTWPQTLNCVEVGGGLSTSGLEAIASRLSGLPALKRVDTAGPELMPLARLPEMVEFGLSLSNEEEVTVAASQVGERRIARLELWADGTGEALRGARLSARVRRLSLHTEPGGLEAVLRRTQWPLLRELQVHLPASVARIHGLSSEAITFTPGDIDGLAACKALRQLEVLELNGVLGEELANVLIDALVRARPKLVRLSLNAGEIGNDALAKLAKAGLLTDLRELELYHCKLKAKGFLALLDPQGPRALRKLVLAKNSATQPAIAALASWPGLATVERLDLREVSLATGQRETLQLSPFLRPEALDITTSDFW